MAESTNNYIGRAKIVMGRTFNKFEYINISQGFGGHNSFEISFAPNMLSSEGSGDKIELKRWAEEFMGKQITIELMQGLKDDKSNTVIPVTSQNIIFKGIVTTIKMNKYIGNNGSILVGGSGPTMLLTAGATTRTFTEKKLSVVIDNVLSPFAGLIKNDIKLSNDPILLYITQYEEDNFHFLQRLAEIHGEWMFYDGQTLIFGKPILKNNIVELSLGTNVFNFDYRLRVIPLNLEAQCYNYEKNQVFASSTDSESIKGFEGYNELIYNKSEALYKDKLIELGFQNATSESDLKKDVKHKKHERSNLFAKLSATTTDMNVVVGRLVKLKEPIDIKDPTTGSVKKDEVSYGTFLVTKVNHSLDTRGIYRNTFEAIPHDKDLPPVDYNIISPQAKIQPAIVMKVDDEKGMGRVKVQFPWQKADNEMTPWVRVVNPMASKDQGMYFIPEIDEVVFVDFEFGNPDIPFVTGSMYHGQAKPGGNLFTPDNHLKGIITRGQNHIIIDDTEGKEKILIYNKDKKNKIELSLDGTHISIKSDGDININAGGDIKMKAKNIMMEAEKDWKVKADHAVIETQTGDIELIAGKDLNVSGVNATIAVMAEMKISGTIVEIEADVSAKFKASATLDIDGGAMATLKGAMVMIN